MPYNWRDERDAAVARIAKNEGFVPRIYYDSRGIPTVGYGSALTNKDKAPWTNLGDTLGALGVDSGKHADIIGGIGSPANPGKIEPWRQDGKYQNPPPFDVLVEKPKARAVMANHVDQDEAALRRQLGLDAAGVSNWEKLEPKMRSALLDARYNTPDLINTGITGVLQHQEDPAWRDKAWWELAVNVKDPNARREDEADSFTTNSMLKSPVENLFNRQRYRDGIYDTVRAAVGDAAQSGGITPPPPEPEVRLWNEERDAGPAPGNLLNANALPENLFNMPESERRKWGIR